MCDRDSFPYVYLREAEANVIYRRLPGNFSASKSQNSMYSAHTRHVWEKIPQLKVRYQNCERLILKYHTNWTQPSLGTELSHNIDNISEKCTSRMHYWREIDKKCLKDFSG